MRYNLPFARTALPEVPRNGPSYLEKKKRIKLIEISVDLLFVTFFLNL